ncbi:hypothetical protein BGX27_007848 [Mortierella sp. AM989]|nr:hypothetical protein BGX27_007848 [Mortierella sp. AM989]
MPASLSTPYRSSRWPSRFLIATGVIHTAYAFIFDEVRVPLVQAILGGYFNQFDHSIERGLSFWFVIGGLNMIWLGKTMDWYLFPDTPSGAIMDNTIHEKDGNQITRRQHEQDKVRSDKKLPRQFGYWLLGMGVGGIAAIPKSGFYLLALQGMAILFSE